MSSLSADRSTHHESTPRPRDTSPTSPPIGTLDECDVRPRRQPWHQHVSPTQLEDLWSGATGLGSGSRAAPAGPGSRAARARKPRRAGRVRAKQSNGADLRVCATAICASTVTCACVPVRACVPVHACVRTCARAGACVPVCACMRAGVYGDAINTLVIIVSRH